MLLFHALLLLLLRIMAIPNFGLETIQPCCSHVHTVGEPCYGGSRYSLHPWIRSHSHTINCRQCRPPFAIHSALLTVSVFLQPEGAGACGGAGRFPPMLVGIPMLVVPARRSCPGVSPGADFVPLRTPVIKELVGAALLMRMSILPGEKISQMIQTSSLLVNGMTTQTPMLATGQLAPSGPYLTVKFGFILLFICFSAVSIFCHCRASF